MSRLVPDCHKWQGAVVVLPTGDVGPAAGIIDTRCAGSRCSAFIPVPSPTDPLLRQGVCGLVRPGAEPWPDPNPPEVPRAR